MGFLGFQLDWGRRFDDDAPRSHDSRNGLVLRLSEHHGDAYPGSTVLVQTTGLEGYHREITAKGYRFMRPGISGPRGTPGSWR